MKYIIGYDVLGFPDYFKMGIELEAYNVKIRGKAKDGLYEGESKKFIEDRKWHMAGKDEESLVSHGGAELVSPILKDRESDWRTLTEICNHMKQYPGKDGDKVIADEKCGLHIHFDANCLTTDPKKLKMFLHIYAEAEEILYKMCNDKDNPIRPGAINKNRHGLTNLISSMWRNGMASPTGEKILKQIENDTLKVSYKKFGVLKRSLAKYKLDERRYHGLNLTNIGNPKKNTIEFRMANGTLEPEVIKQTAFLYGSLINTAIQAVEHPEKYQEKLNQFFKTDVTEEQKADSFLNLMMDSEEDKKIYKERWESVKDAKVFAKNDKKGFAKNRFQKEEFGMIAQRTPDNLVKQMFTKIKNMMKSKNIEKNKIVGGEIYE